MESAVFLYFVSIGAGFTFGVASIGLPAFWLYKKIKNRGDKHVVKTTKRAV